MIEMEMHNDSSVRENIANVNLKIFNKRVENARNHAGSLIGLIKGLKAENRELVKMALQRDQVISRLRKEANEDCNSIDSKSAKDDCGSFDGMKSATNVDDSLKCRGSKNNGLVGLRKRVADMEKELKLRADIEIELRQKNKQNTLVIENLKMDLDTIRVNERNLVGKVKELFEDQRNKEKEINDLKDAIIVEVKFDAKLSVKDPKTSTLAERKNKLELDDIKNLDIIQKEFDIAYNANIVINELKLSNPKRENSPHKQFKPNVPASTNAAVGMERCKTVKVTQKRSMIPRRFENNMKSSPSHHNTNRTIEEPRSLHAYGKFGSELAPVKSAPIEYRPVKKRTARLLGRCQ